MGAATRVVSATCRLPPRSTCRRNWARAVRENSSLKFPSRFG